MQLTKERRNEISWELVIYGAKRKGLPPLKRNEFQREVLNVAKEINIPKEEALEFTKELLLSLVNDITTSETGK